MTGGDGQTTVRWTLRRQKRGYSLRRRVWRAIRPQTAWACTLRHSSHPVTVRPHSTAGQLPARQTASTQGACSARLWLRSSDYDPTDSRAGDAHYRVSCAAVLPHRTTRSGSSHQPVPHSSASAHSRRHLKAHIKAHHLGRPTSSPPLVATGHHGSVTNKAQARTASIPDRRKA